MDLCISVVLLTICDAIHVRPAPIKLVSDVFSDVGPLSDEIEARRAAADLDLTNKIDKEIRLGFPLMKRNPEPLWNRVHEAKDTGSTDPCDADLLMNGLTYPYGFGDRAMMIVDELQVAAHLNQTVAICDGNSRRQGINWSNFFANSGFGVCGDPDRCLVKSNSAGWLGSKMSKAFRKESHNNAKMLTHIKHLLYRQLFTFNDETNRIVADTLQNAGLVNGSRYIGVHIRRGDKIASRNFATAVYAKAVSEELETRNLNTVFVASDDEHAGHKLELELRLSRPSAAVIQIFSESSSSRTYDDSNAMLALLTDVAALRDAEVFIGTHLSYIGRFVYFLRDPRAESKSVSGDWLKGNMI